MDRPMYSNWDVEYPAELNEAQTHVLDELATHCTSDDELRGMAARIEANRLPVLAERVDVDVAEAHFKNVATHDVLVVVAHCTGDDLAIRTHWLIPGQSVLRSIMGTDLVYPRSGP